MLLGVMEVCWPLARDGFPDALRHQVSDLAQACADLLSTRIEDGGLAIMRSRPALTGLLDSLLEISADRFRAAGRRRQHYRLPDRPRR